MAQLCRHLRLLASNSKVRAAFVLVAVLLALSPVEAFASKRLALLLANSAYVHTTQLRNPSNDVKVIATKLKDLGFLVRLESDLDARRFAEVLDDFSKSLDKDTDALFYYAGHGVQFRGENLLVGVDARLQGEATLPFETY